ncbi:MAG TPA: tyrosine-type recombinase/integrase, partial [Allocoleopsis sp.]
EDGKAVYIAQNIHHKNAKCRDDTREYQLPEILTPALDTWIQKYRPLAIQAVQSLDTWLRFAGYKPDELENLKQRIANAQQGIVPPRIKDVRTYVRNLQRRISSVESRITAWPTAKMNIESNHLFFCTGSNHPTSFGKPLSSGSVYMIVKRAVAEASLALFQREYWLGPHSFRHIAAAHVRRHGGDKTTLALLMGHDEDMGDKYAAQLQNDISLTALADNWWLPSKL